MKRADTIRLRVTPAERARIEEMADSKGLKMSEWLRRAGMGMEKTRRRSEPGHVTPEPRAETDAQRATREAFEAPVPQVGAEPFEERVRQLAVTMPRRNAEMVVRREMAREANLAEQG